MQASTSKTANTLCGICQDRSAIYTCPGCSIRTCSLPCSKSHKSHQSCSGERDRTAYVPMNRYSWGNMADDYTYLEEVGRKAAEWGLDIVKRGFLTSAIMAGRGRGRGRGRARGREGRGGMAKGGGRGKREVLRMHLDARDIDMEILPPGMEKRRVNQSSWVAKSILMTIEFVFHMVKDAFAPRDASESLPFILLTHRNSLDATVSDVIRRHIRDHGKKADVPAWVQSYFSSEADDAQLVYLMSQPVNSPSNLPYKAYHKLDSTQSLLAALRNKAFVEYPTIDIWEEGDFTGRLVEVDGLYEEGEEELPPVKRRRLDAVGGREVINSLLGGYTSNEEGQEESSVMSMLGGYGSDEESLQTVEAEKDQNTEEMDDVEEPTLEHVHDILVGIGDDDSCSEDQIPMEEEVGEDSDWGDSSDDKAEEFVRELERQAACRRPT